MEEYIQVFMTTGRREEAEMIAKILVEKRAAGCVQIVGPVLSTYRWKGKIETAQEWLCLIKSKRNLYDELERKIKETHTYEIPEIVALPIVAGSKEYLDWLNKEL